MQNNNSQEQTKQFSIRMVLFMQDKLRSLGVNLNTIYNSQNLNNLTNQQRLEIITGLYNQIKSLQGNNNSRVQFPIDDNSNKKSILFKTMQNLIKYVTMDLNDTIKMSIDKYLRIVGRAEYIGNTKGNLAFVYNAKKLDCNSNMKIKDFFRSPNPVIIVTDVKNIIGA